MYETLRCETQEDNLLEYYIIICILSPTNIFIFSGEATVLIITLKLEKRDDAFEIGGIYYYIFI